MFFKFHLKKVFKKMKKKLVWEVTKYNLLNSILILKNDYFFDI